MSGEPPRDDDDPPSLFGSDPPQDDPAQSTPPAPLRESGPAPFNSTGLDEVLRGGSTPSFFPPGEEDLDSYLDQLLPSLVPPGPVRRDSDSGMRMSRPSLERPRSFGDDVSQVIALHDEPLPAEPAPDTWNAFSSSDALALLALDVRGVDVDGAAPVDEASLATLTSLPRRALRLAPNPLGADDGPGLEARAQLLERLAEHVQPGGVQARLLSCAAELQERRGALESARELRARACSADPSDVHALRETRRDAALALDFPRSAELLEREATLPSSPAERSLLLTLLAELRMRSLGDRPGALLAAQQALEADHGALAAALLAAELHYAAGDRLAAAHSLQLGAQGVQDGALRCGLLCHAGRTLLSAGAAAQGKSLFEQATEADPSSSEARLGLYRAARAAGDAATAAHCLTRLAELLPEGNVRGELLRRRGTLELWVLGDPHAALSSLSGTDGQLALRARHVAAQRTGDVDTRRAALEGWVAQGAQPALGWLELAQQQAERGELEPARESLERAAELDPELSLIRVAQQQLARRRGDTASLANVVGEQGERNRLGAAAKLGPGPDMVPRERELLLLARAELDDKPTTEALLLDAAAGAGDLEAVRRGLWGRAERGSWQRRVGPLTALLDLHVAAADSEAVREVLRTGLRATAGSTSMLRQALDAERDVETRAGLWRAEAARVAPARAAFAQTMAARELAAAGQDAAGAYEAALGSVPGYGPAAWALERTARRAGYSDALVRVHEALADAEPDPLEQRARRIRTALLYASTNPVLASEYLLQALGSDPADPIVADLLLRIGASGAGPRLADALLQAASAAAPDWQRAERLRAAALLADGAEHERAGQLYRELLAERPTELRASQGLEQALHAQAQPEALRAWLTARVAEAADGVSREHALEQLARLELTLGVPDAAVLALEQLLAEAPGDVPTLRELSRLAMQADRKLALGRYAEALASQLDDPGDRSAELWQALRLRDQAKTRDQAELDGLVERLIRDGRPEVWAALANEELARRAGRPHAVADAVARVESLLADPDERASLAMRAAEALEPLSNASALDALEEEAEAAPGHPLIQEELGRLAQSTGHLERAMLAFSSAATGARSDERRLRLWYRVAVLAQDRLGATSQAVEALEHVVTLDVLYREAFNRLRSLYRDAGNQTALIRLYERRLERGAPAALVAELNTELCQLALELGDRSAAKRALTVAMEADPDRVETQQALAALHLSDGDHRAAADVLVRVARSARDSALVLWAFRQLGALYDGPLPDLKRAEIAYTRVLGIDPDDDATVERLASIFERSGQGTRALRAWETLADRHASDPAEWERYTLKIAEQLARGGEAPAAERLLERMRSERPTSLGVVEALTAHYAGQAAQPSVLVHLDRSIHAFRSAVREQPGSLEAWQGLIATLEARPHPRAAAACRSAARSLGHGGIASPVLTPTGLGTRVRSSDAAHRALPRRLTAALRGLFAAAAPAFDRVAPYRTDDTSPRPLRSLPDEVISTARRVSTWFGLPNPVIHTCTRSLCLTIREQPFTLVIGERLLDAAELPALTYLMARAAAQAAEHLSFVARAQPEELELGLRGLLCVLDPNHATIGNEREAVERMAATLAPQLGGHTRELAAGAFELASEARIDVLGLSNLAMEVGAREALLASADLGGALRGIARCSATLEAPASALELIRQDAEADALLYFAVSDHYFAALEEAPE
jgi:hypothetical protein